MKYNSKSAFEAVNLFGTGTENTHFAKYFDGTSYINLLSQPEECPAFMANITFEPGCRNHWHIHQSQSGGGQILVCTAGEGWYQEEGKKPVLLSEGSIVYIPTGVKHWHGAKKDSWFSHISIEVPGVDGKTDWLEPVDPAVYNNLKDLQPKKKAPALTNSKKIVDKNTFDQKNLFKTGMYNFMLKKYFSKRSYLKMLTRPGKVPMFLANVSFEPGCVNNWHIHHAKTDGGQILICTIGEGWYQEEGKEKISLVPGSVVYIPAGVKHWHGAKKDTWFSHIAISVPGEEAKNEWCEAVEV